MIVLGLILLIIGYLLPLHILFTLGVILLVIGVVIEVMGAVGYTLGGRRHWY